MTIGRSGRRTSAACGAALSCTGTCNGAGACTTARAGAQCAPAKCTDTSHGVGATTCVSTGAACPPQDSRFDCNAYACEPQLGACRSLCTATEHCATGFVCDAPNRVCVPGPSVASAGGCSCGVAGSAEQAPLAAFGALAGVALVGRKRARRRPA